MLITKNTVITDVSKNFEYFIDVHVNGEYQVKRTDLINNLTDVIFISSSYTDMMTFMYGIQKAVIG
jgi:predicted methyltransferase